jgi:hypothetical protein
MLDSHLSGGSFVGLDEVGMACAKGERKITSLYVVRTTLLY